jgi:hypothetical protein
MLLRWIGATLTDASLPFRAVRRDRNMKRLLSVLAERAEGATAILLTCPTCSTRAATASSFKAARDIASIGFSIHPPEIIVFIF